MAMFRKGSRGISPMVAIVLLVAFTVGIGGILSVWLTSLAAKQTEETGAAAEKQALCSRSVLEITEVKYELGAADISNVTVLYTYGTENLYNFTLIFIDNERNVVTINRSMMNYGDNKQYNNSAGQYFEPGMVAVWNVNNTMGLNLGGTSLYSVRVNSLCQINYPVSAECKSNQPCMK